MRIRKGYVLREVVGEKLLVATGAVPKKAAHMIILTESAALLWNSLQKGFTHEQLEKETMCNYPNADSVQVHNDIEAFIHLLKTLDALEEENENIGFEHLTK